MVVQVVVLSANGEPRQSRVTSGEVSAAAVTKLCRKTKPAAAIATAIFGELTLTLWGWKEGKAGTENKHELPPPFDEETLFGDAVVSATSTEDEAAHGFTIAQWEKFCAEGAGAESDEEGPDGDEDGDEDGDLSLDEEDEEGADEGDAAGEEAEAEEDEEADDEEEGDEAEEDGADDDCYDDGDEGGGGSGKRRAPRRKATTAPEYRRLDMGLRARVKVPMPVGKRAPRWQTAPELEEEAYD